MGKGKRYELDMLNAIAERTTDEVWVGRPDYSGNSGAAVADLVVVWPDYSDGVANGVFFELKKRSADVGKRTNVMSGSKSGQTGREELQELLDETPPWGRSAVVVRFPNRRPIVMEAPTLAAALDAGAEGTLVGHPRLTRGGNVSMYKPSLDVWWSAASGRPEYKQLLDGLGFPGGYWSDDE